MFLVPSSKIIIVLSEKNRIEKFQTESLITLIVTIL